MQKNRVICNKKWRLLRSKLLGKGAFGKVFLGEEIKTGREVAIKEIAFDKDDDELIQRQLQEILTMMKYSVRPQTNLLRIIDFALEQDHIYLVLEYCEGGSLEDYMEMDMQNGNLPDIEAEKKALKIAHQIALGLSVLHKEFGIAHRDLKPEHVLCKGGSYLLSNFGSSTQQ